MIEYTYIYCERILPFPSKLINASITLHTYLFFFSVRIFEFYSLSKYLLYNTVLLNTVTMLYNRSLDIIYFITETVYLFTNFIFLPLPNPWQPLFYCFYKSNLLFNFTYKWYHTVLAFLIWLNSLSIMPSSFIHVTWGGRIGRFIFHLLVYTWNAPFGSFLHEKLS